MTVANDFLSTSPADQSSDGDRSTWQSLVGLFINAQSNLILLTVGLAAVHFPFTHCALCKAQPHVCFFEISVHLIVMPIFDKSVLLIALRIVCLLDTLAHSLFVHLARHCTLHTNPNLPVEQETVAPKFDSRASRKLALASVMVSSPSTAVLLLTLKVSMPPFSSMCDLLTEFIMATSALLLCQRKRRRPLSKPTRSQRARAI